jgi:hypothetical protein
LPLGWAFLIIIIVRKPSSLEEGIFSIHILFQSV